MKLALSVIRFPVDVQYYNSQAQREVHDLFTKETSEKPVFSSFYIILEGCPVNGVKSIPSEASAFHIAMTTSLSLQW